MKIWMLIMVGACFSCEAFNSEGSKLEGEKMSDDIEQILSQSKAFSQAYMEEDSIRMAEFYGKNGKILPPNQGIINEKKEIIGAWHVPPGADITFHKSVSDEITLVDSIAIDYGYYGGSILSQENIERIFSGKYVIIWIKEKNKWIMKLDIWNRREAEHPNFYLPHMDSVKTELSLKKISEEKGKSGLIQLPEGEQMFINHEEFFRVSLNNSDKKSSIIQPSGRYVTIKIPQLSHELIKETKSDIFQYAVQRNLKLSEGIFVKKTDDNKYSISQFIQKQNPPWKIDIRKPGDDNKEILTLRGVVYDVDGKTPMPNFNLWVFHTDSEGFYSKNEKGEDEGWRKSRYSKRFKTGDKGQFEITTIRPAGYPNSINPEHIHIRIDHPKFDEQEHTVYFTDSERYGKTIQDLQKQYDFVYVLDVAKGPKNLVNWNIILLKESNLHSE